ncbi:MAG: hypothetical protein ACFFDN_47320, partial [Candidatus Hodarchaeota archaeon]
MLRIIIAFQLRKGRLYSGLATIICLFFFSSLVEVQAAEVLLVDTSNKPSIVKEQLELACRFYGLDMKYLLEEGDKNNLQWLVA